MGQFSGATYGGSPYKSKARLEIRSRSAGPNIPLSIAQGGIYV